MHSCRLPLWLAASFWAALSVLPSRATVDEDFAAASVLFNRAQNLEQSGVPKYALSTYNDCYARLQKVRTTYPNWNSDKVAREMADCFAEIDKLGGEVNGKLLAPAPIPADATASPTPASNSSPFQPAKYGLTGSLPYPRSFRSYPWKTGIVTTVFWIGEDRGSDNKRSAWDPRWVRDNSGSDDPYNLSGYASAKHASTLNPFYVALPFNDVAYPEKAPRWLPSGWSAATAGSKTASACKDRWVEIKDRAGRVCFAQWEDVGPGAGDEAEYVFGNAKPRAEPGLGISPAVAKYLGIDSCAITSWRFADDDSVLPGMWLRYDEQALLFSALREQGKTTAK